MENSAERKEKVPVFSSWKKWYWLVGGSLIFYIVIFYLFRIAFE